VKKAKTFRISWVFGENDEQVYAIGLDQMFRDDRLIY
jgi:hypothetical protein